jgi:hypothetical protein
MKVAELIAKLRQYDPEEPVLVRMTVGLGADEDVYTEHVEHVYRGRAGAVIVDGAP